MDFSKYEQISIASAQELKDWLTKNCQSNNSYWLVTYKKVVADKYVSREDVLDLLIAFGWIDGIRQKLDGERTMQLICRRKNHIWAKTYKERAASLIAANLMQTSGLDVIAYSKANNLWDALANVDELIIPPDLERALLTKLGDTQPFELYAPSYRRNILRWLSTAKTETTRSKRIEKIIVFTENQEKIPNY